MNSGTPSPSPLSLDELQLRIRSFAAERAWDEFHTPRNLMIALIAEVGELAEFFLWLEDDQILHMMDDPARSRGVQDELADVLGCLVRLADVLDISLADAVETKIRKNAYKYPVSKAYGNARKYDRLI